MFNISFTTESLAAFAAAGLLCTAAPILTLIIIKKKNKDVPIAPFFIGCGVFLVFALVLEQLLHAVMLPLVQDSLLLYTVYGALAAGIFEETGRFLAYKTVMKKYTDPRASLVYGIGHGGIEAIVLVGISMLSYFVLGIMTNTMGIDEVIKLTADGDMTSVMAVIQQLGVLSRTTFGTAMLSVFERIIAVAFHISASVIVFEAARVKGRLWLYPGAVILHALLDVPAVLYQTGEIGLSLCYIIMTVFTGIVVFLGICSFKRIKKYTAYEADQKSEERKEAAL